MGPTDGSYTYCGWNIDDIQLFSNVCVDVTGGCCVGTSCYSVSTYDCTDLSGTYQGDGSGCSPSPCAPALCLGDANCDLAVNWRDIDYFVAGLNDNLTAWQARFLPGTPSCSYGNLDVNADTHVNWRDIDPFVAQLNKTCP